MRGHIRSFSNTFLKCCCCNTNKSEARCLQTTAPEIFSLTNSTATYFNHLWLQYFFHSSDSTSTRWRCGPAPSRKSNGAGTRPRPRSKPSPSRGRGGRKVGGRRAEKAAERHKWQVGSIPLTGNFTPSYFSLKCGFRSVSHSCELEELNWQLFAPFLLLLRRSAVTAVFISLKSVPHWVTWRVECVWWDFTKLKL